MKQKKIAIASGKGGTGKTSFSINFAQSLSKKMSVTLLDCDVEEPNCSLFFREKESIQYDPVLFTMPVIDNDKCTLCGKCKDACMNNAIFLTKKFKTVLPEMCKGCLRCTNHCDFEAMTTKKVSIGSVEQWKINDNFTIYEGLLKNGDIHTTAVIKALKETKTQSNIVLLDSPPGTTCPMVDAVSDVDYVILVTEPTPYGLHDLRLAVDVIKQLKLNLSIIINKSGSNDSIIEDFCKDKSLDILGKIPFNQNIAKHGADGKLIYELKECKEAFIQIIDRLQERIS